MNEENESAVTAEDTEYALTIRKRVIQFIQKWVIAVRQAVFEEPLTVAFIEVNDFFFHHSHFHLNMFCSTLYYIM